MSYCSTYITHCSCSTDEEDIKSFTDTQLMQNVYYGFFTQCTQKGRENILSPYSCWSLSCPSSQFHHNTTALVTQFTPFVSTCALTHLSMLTARNAYYGEDWKNIQGMNPADLIVRICGCTFYNISLLLFRLHHCVKTLPTSWLHKGHVVFQSWNGGALLHVKRPLLFYSFLPQAISFSTSAHVQPINDWPISIQEHYYTILCLCSGWTADSFPGHICPMRAILLVLNKSSCI